MIVIQFTKILSEQLKNKSLYQQLNMMFEPSNLTKLNPDIWKTGIMDLYEKMDNKGATVEDKTVTDSSSGVKVSKAKRVSFNENEEITYTTDNTHWEKYTNWDPRKTYDIIYYLEHPIHLPRNNVCYIKDGKTCFSEK